jgi:hypothetical protein
MNSNPIHASSLTHAEYYRLNGTLDGSRIEALLDGDELLERLGGVVVDLAEARAGYPAEDWAAELLGGMQQLAKSLRGANREAMTRLLEQLEQLQTSIANDVEYGREKLDAAIEAFENVKGGKKPEGKKQ